jgi:hypothetical protein
MTICALQNAPERKRDSGVGDDYTGRGFVLIDIETVRSTNIFRDVEWSYVNL